MLQMLTWTCYVFVNEKCKTLVKHNFFSIILLGFSFNSDIESCFKGTNGTMTNVVDKFK